jgi:hypothetical protein
MNDGCRARRCGRAVALDPASPPAQTESEEQLVFLRDEAHLEEA